MGYGLLFILIQDVHMPLTSLGDYITKNPWILQQKPVKIRQHVTYLSSKLFTEQSIAHICVGSRYWLNMPLKVCENICYCNLLSHS